MKLSLDTCAYSQLAREHTGLSECIEGAEIIILSTIMLGELFAGLSSEKYESKTRTELATFIDLPVILFTAILLGTLFFGLKPKGFRFHNDCTWKSGGSGISINDFGMLTAYALLILIPFRTHSVL